MTAKEDLHRLVEALSEEHFEEARTLLQRLHEAPSEIDDEPLTEEDLASIERGTEDLRSGRAKSLDQYERERGQ